MSLARITSPSQGGFDEPVTDPSNDLLDMKNHAHALARYIKRHEDQLPFTVGIFGEWGEGKTTLARFLCHHLKELEQSSSQRPIRFIPFSAWPFTTSEKLWRALILQIAKVLLQSPESAPPVGDKVKPSTGWLVTLTHFLNGDALVIKAAKPEPDEYQELVEQLDRIDYGNVSNRSASPQLDQEATMMAVVNGALTALGTVSPLMAGLRSLLGIETSVDVSKLVKETNQTSRESIEALPKFEEIFGQMVNDKAAEGPVYVFIDDLDRAQPDVALDIMESIRIALSKVKCVFILAVDERLIAEGLRLRYKELFAQEGAENFKNKGQEYLEKIIQLRMRVPPRTSEQAQRLIAAQFPQWMPAGDIIQSVIGNNPRRLKQYCERLTFQYMIGSLPFTLGFRPPEEGAGDVAIPGSKPDPVTKPKSEPVERDEMPDENGPQVSEPVYLARKLRRLDGESLSDLFLDLGQDFGRLDEDPHGKINRLVADFRATNKLGVLRGAMERLYPDIFVDESREQGGD